MKNIRTKSQKIKIAIILSTGLSGFSYLFYTNWKIGIAIFLIIWANNLEQKMKI